MALILGAPPTAHLAHHPFSPLTGFIGSHTALALLEHGYKITIIDNLENSFQLAVDRIAELATDKASNMTFIKADLRDYDALDKIFAETKSVFLYSHSIYTAHPSRGNYIHTTSLTHIFHLLCSALQIRCRHPLCRS